ncbi:MAG: DivIVA domain-containing protein [Propionibacteriaceae bacterium]|jgi:DivIVA domain-containing protein|nr:DivIVA domain-containing protein [Propionibacteriaceae bacterium]
MDWFLWALGALIFLGGVFVIGVWQHGTLPKKVVDLPAPTGLPEGDITADELRAYRFSAAGRNGYSATQVDALLELVAQQLEGSPADEPEAEAPAEAVPADSDGDGDWGKMATLSPTDEDQDGSHEAADR